MGRLLKHDGGVPVADHCLCGVRAPVDELNDFHVANGAGVPLNDETR